MARWSGIICIVCRQGSDRRITVGDTGYIAGRYMHIAYNRRFNGVNAVIDPGKYPFDLRAVLESDDLLVLIGKNNCVCGQDQNGKDKNNLVHNESLTSIHLLGKQG